MKNLGFTLAEVLITLGIIGVVAALTTPALVKNSGQAKIGPSLAKFVNTFETATEQMFAHENLSSINNISTLLPSLSKYMVMTPTEIESYKFKAGDGTVTDISEDIKSAKEMKEAIEGAHGADNEGIYFQCGDDVACIKNEKEKAVQPYQDLINSTVYTLKDGTLMIVIPLTRDAVSKGAYKGVVAEVIFDINGNKAENKAGKDVFDFLLDRSGILIPVGSIAHKFVQQTGKYANDYNADCSTTSNSLSSNFACTGKIVDNNYKAD